VSNSANQDKLLKTIQYSLWMLSRFYYTNSKNATARDALSKLSGEVSWARYVTRLLGLPQALEGVQSGGSWVSSKSLGKVMAWSMVFYYPLEALAFLKWKAPQWISIGAPPSPSSPSFGSKSSNNRLAEQASAWSCRFWLAYIVADIVRSALALQPEKNIRISSSLDNDDNELTAADAAAAATPSTITTERLQLVRNALFVVPAIHWSLPNWDTQPLLSETTCNSLMWLEALVCMYQAGI
jgi:hypothetical protein